ncbi:hypothetical protein LTR16_005049, partial [Cryomyces antarcticus]
MSLDSALAAYIASPATLHIFCPELPMAETLQMQALQQPCTPSVQDSTYSMRAISTRFRGLIVEQNVSGPLQVSAPLFQHRYSCKEWAPSAKPKRGAALSATFTFEMIRYLAVMGNMVRREHLYEALKGMERETIR